MSSSPHETGPATLCHGTETARSLWHSWYEAAVLQLQSILDHPSLQSLDPGDAFWTDALTTPEQTNRELAILGDLSSTVFRRVRAMQKSVFAPEEEVRHYWKTYWLHHVWDPLQREDLQRFVDQQTQQWELFQEMRALEWNAVLYPENAQETQRLEELRGVDFSTVARTEEEWQLQQTHYLESLPGCPDALAQVIAALFVDHLHEQVQRSSQVALYYQPSDADFAYFHAAGRALYHEWRHLQTHFPFCHVDVLSVEPMYGDSLRRCAQTHEGRTVRIDQKAAAVFQLTPSDDRHSWTRTFLF